MLNLNSIALQSTTAYQGSKLSKIDRQFVMLPNKKRLQNFLLENSLIFIIPPVGFSSSDYASTPSIASEYHFQEWLYRALIFLVISCPCALVILFL